MGETVEQCPGQTLGAEGLGIEEDYSAFVAGAEYTLYAVFETEADLSLLAEWNRDERDERATNVFQNDIFVGARLGLNGVDDTDFVVGMLADADFGTRSFNAEFNTCLSDLWSLHAEAVAFQDVDMAGPTYVSRRDSFIELNLTYSF